MYKTSSLHYFKKRFEEKKEDIPVSPEKKIEIIPDLDTESIQLKKKRRVFVKKYNSIKIF